MGGGSRAVGRVGWPLSSSRTQQLVQMAVEAGPSKSGSEEPACKKLQPTMGGKAPQKKFLWAGQVKKPRRYWPGTVALHEIWHFHKSRAHDLETPLLVASLWDNHTSRQMWHALPGAHYYIPARSCRGIYSRPHGRCKPLHHSCKTGYNYAQGYSVSLPQLGRASTLLKSSQKSVSEFSVGCRLCGIFDQYRGWEVRVDTQSGLYRILFM